MRKNSMEIKINIPDKSSMIKDGINVAISPRGVSWFQSVLGNKAKEKGVYVIHHVGAIKYVGKTNGAKMTFGIRLRRHFQETAAGKHTYPRLAQLVTPPEIKVTIYSLEEICKLTSHNLNSPIRIQLIPIFESALIAAYKPEFQS